MHMIWGRVQGGWRLVAGVAKARWGELTDRGFGAIAGRGQPADRIQERRATFMGDTDDQLSDEVIARAPLFADTEAGWRAP